MPLDPKLVHPSLAGAASALVRHGDVGGLGLTEPQRIVAETIVALLGSARVPEEMAEYVAALNAALDASGSDGALLEPLRAARDAARSLESARSGMAGDLALDRLRLALDDARARIAGPSAPDLG